ncbi:hypothetical protein BZG02_05430 [Labilibaculum filiforme]|uniref:PKD domain-containing protein n=1 Tax=Labilibaculum filiforme TaxID=1940526 RepID=A0A2N3I1T1_9BACT|nr:hypothetical protein [Labilibaculum filiforme]PKQ64265.1 hypothetical protein BZG02_05430 [Labilibaculum filiforme]
MYNQKHSYKKLKRVVERKFAKGKSQFWKNRDYEDLSFVIHQETKILISVATLKRFFGKVKTADDYAPQNSTLEALSGYADVQEKQKSIVNSYKLVLVFSIGLVAIACAIWFIASNTTSDKSELIQKCTLALVKQEGRCPGTAFFEFTIPTAKENIFLNFGDGTKKLPIKKEQKHAHFYEYPGNFQAFLQVENTVVSDTVAVFIPTHDWQIFAHYFKPDLIDRYYPVPINKNVCDGVFHASSKSIGSLGIDTSEIVVVRIDCFAKTEFSGDSFRYKTRFKNSSYWPAVRCYSTSLILEGSEGSIQFKFVGEGCSRFSYYQLGEKLVNGNNSDLTNFVVDHNHWVDAEIINKDRNVIVKSNDKVIFSGNYTKSIGKIVGTSVIFHGSGSVDYIHLKSENNDCIFENDF